MNSLVTLVNLLGSLLLHILALIVDLPPLLLLLTVTSDSSTHAADSALGTVNSALAQILQVFAGLSLLAGLVLLDTLLADRVDASQVTDGLLGGANSLVPSAGVGSSRGGATSRCFSVLFTPLH